jgi:hypothetical protein
MQAHIHLVGKYCLKVIQADRFVNPRCLNLCVRRCNRQCVWIAAFKAIFQFLFFKEHRVRTFCFVLPTHKHATDFQRTLFLEGQEVLKSFPGGCDKKNPTRRRHIEPYSQTTKTTSTSHKEYYYLAQRKKFLPTRESVAKSGSNGGRGSTKTRT